MGNCLDVFLLTYSTSSNHTVEMTFQFRKEEKVENEQGLVSLESAAVVSPKTFSSKNTETASQNNRELELIYSKM